jgi:hypothetical protein
MEGGVFQSVFLALDYHRQARESKLPAHESFRRNLKAGQAGRGTYAHQARHRVDTLSPLSLSYSKNDGKFDTHCALSEVREQTDLGGDARQLSIPHVWMLQLQSASLLEAR